MDPGGLIWVIPAKQRLEASLGRCTKRTVSDPRCPVLGTHAAGAHLHPHHLPAGREVGYLDVRHPSGGGMALGVADVVATPSYLAAQFAFGHGCFDEALRFEYNPGRHCSIPWVLLQQNGYPVHLQGEKSQGCRTIAIHPSICPTMSRLSTSGRSSG